MSNTRNGFTSSVSGLFAVLFTLLLCTLMFTGIPAHAEKPEDETHHEYAVLQEDGRLIFFESDNWYESLSRGSFRDIMGKSSYGTVGRISEGESCHAAELQAVEGVNVRQIMAAEGQVINTMTDMSFWFDGLSDLTDFNDQGFDTHDVISMKGLFRGCESLHNISLSSFTTYSVQDMSMMFCSCKSLENLDISAFNTEGVRDMSYMFSECNSLKDLTLGTFRTYSVNNMAGMFNWCESLEELNVSGFDTSSVTDMSSMFCCCKSLKQLDLRSFGTSSVTDMSSMFDFCESLTGLELGYFETSNVKDMTRMFCGCSSLVSLSLPYFNTLSATSMYGMFSDCYSLENIDLSAFNTVNVKDMGYMFNNDYSLQNLDVSGFETRQVTNMSHMFNGCSKLGDLEVGRFDTSNVTDMYNMFCGCELLETLDVSNFQTAKVKDMTQMFAGCSKLKNLNLHSFNTRAVTSLARMFSRCHMLKELDLAGFDTSSVTDMQAMFDSCVNLTRVWLGGLFTVWHENGCLPNNGTWTNGAFSMSNLELCREYPRNAALWGGKWYIDRQYAVLQYEGDMTLFHSEESYLDGESGIFTDERGMVYTGVIWRVSNLSYAFNTIEQKAEVKIKSISAAGGQPIDAFGSWMYFTNMQELEEFNGSNMDTSGLQTLGFSNCPKLKELDLSMLDLHSIISTSGMFYNCYGLKEISFGEWDAAGVTVMTGMFQNCSSLVSLDLSDFDTSSVQSMNYMFSGCTSLKELNVSGFNTSKVTDMTGMFAYCSSLTELDLSGFRTPALVYMNVYDMGSGSIGDEPYFHRQDYEYPMGLGMFEGCSKLKGIDLSSFNTSSVKYMMKLFDRCESLERIDISSFNTSKVEDMKWMFGYNGNESTEIHCPKLKSVRLGSKFTVWKADATFPPLASWTNSKIKKTASELQKEYPSNAASWAGYWIPDDGSFPFVDVKEGKFYYEPVNWAYFHNPQITTGTDAIHFSPNNTCTRGQVVTFLWRAYGCPEPKTTKNPFADVKKSAFYYKAVLWAVEKNITTGTDPTHFSPNDDCTRAQVVTFMYRAAGSPSVSGVKNPFADVSSKKFYYKAVMWALKNKITGGTDSTHFSPNDPCTRGQIVTFLYRGKKD